MIGYRQEEFQRKMKVLDSAYNSWRNNVRELKNALQGEIQEPVLGEMIDKLKLLEENVFKAVL